MVENLEIEENEKSPAGNKGSNPIGGYVCCGIQRY